ncbi:DUF551 domain-containing protein [Acinetobacter sp. BSP-153]|uniref:DUF551 domain-containing protein n=1 Tax=Acinetobacter sp. BSP-153 TaxID=3344663 RepID=UPI00376F7CCE
MKNQKMPTLAEKQEFWAEQLPNFEATYWLPSHFEYVIFDMEQGNYVIKDGLNKDFEVDATEIWHRVNTGWAMWKKAINFSRKQAQPVPEGFEQAYSEIFSPIVKRPYPRLENGDYKYIEINQGWKLWQVATAQAVPEWISVKDKLPGFNQSVLSCDGFETCVAEYLESCKNEYGVFFEEGFWINGAASIFENVTHWMPLPEAIEAQEQSHD